MRSKFWLVALAACVMALGLAACGSDDDSDDSGTSAAESTETGGGDASVSFVSPEDGSAVNGAVTAEVALENFVIDPRAVGMASEEGSGHLHFSLDDGEYDLPKYSGANGELAVQLGTDGKYSPSVEPKITYSNLPAGEHTLTVALANNDHSDTGSTATTTFTVE